MKKKLMTTMILAILLLSATACGKKDAANTTETPATVSTTTAEQTTEAPAPVSLDGLDGDRLDSRSGKVSAVVNLAALGLDEPNGKLSSGNQVSYAEGFEISNVSLYEKEDISYAVDTSQYSAWNAEAYLDYLKSFNNATYEDKGTFSTNGQEWHAYRVTDSSDYVLLFHQTCDEVLLVIQLPPETTDYEKYTQTDFITYAVN